MKYSEELAKLKNQPEVWNAPTMHNQNKYIFESGLPIAIAEELISKDVWANNTIANKDKQIADLKAELTQKPTVVEVENPVNDELQNKIDFLNRQNLAMAETVKIFKTEIDELRGQLDKFTTTQSFEPIMVTDPKTKEDLTKLEAGAKPAQPLPIWLRSFFDTARGGTYALAGVLASTGVWEMVQVYLATGDFNSESFSKLAISAGVVLAGYLQEQAKNNRKEAEKKKI
jgi:hypothetical protein